MRTPLHFFRDALDCFANYKKWRNAVACGVVFDLIKNDPENEDMAWRLFKLQERMFKEIHEK